MLLKTADWDDTAQAHNALATETAFLSYKIRHEFNEPAHATIVLSDATGSIGRKYDVDAAGDSVWVGPGRAYIEDPTGTPIFDGRIVQALPDMENHRVVLECEDWLSQLDDERITYDMREDLDGEGLRESQLKTDVDNGTFVGPTYVSYAALVGAVSLDGAVEADDTVDANDADANDMELLPAVPVVGDAYFFAFAAPSKGVRINVGRAAQDAPGTVITWKYSQGDDVWAALSGVVDDTAYYNTAGTNDVTWTIPTDWKIDTVGGIADKYWVKAELTTMPWAYTTSPLGTQAWAHTSIVFDDDMDWANDEWNGMGLAMAAGMAGTITMVTGPYDETVTPSAAPMSRDLPANGETVIWTKNNYGPGADPDDTHVHSMYDGASDFAVVYDFREHVTQSPYFTTCTAGRVRMHAHFYVHPGATTEASAEVNIYDHIGAAYVNIGALTVQSNYTSAYMDFSFDIPVAYLGATPKISDTDGISHVQIDITCSDGIQHFLRVDYIWLELDCETEGWSEVIGISDTTATNNITVGADLSPTGKSIWETCPYSIVRPIYKHIDTAETPGELVSDGGVDVDYLYTMTAAANVEHTTGYSTRHYTERTRLEIVQDLAEQDKSIFFIELGTVALTWKSTFNDGAPTAMTDASVLKWSHIDRDWKSVYNSVMVYGVRVGDNQLSGTDSDATSISTYGITRTKIESKSGLLSEHDCTALADILVAQNKDIQLFLQAEIGGLSALRLGDEVSITSTYLGLTAAKYTITHWAYDSAAYRTNIRLHPRVSKTGHQENRTLFEINAVQRTVKTLKMDQYNPSLTTQEWS